ncbi:MAG: COX15/CtaA family protein [Gammaproteobacteria bacterium]
MANWYRRIATFAVVLSLTVVVLGAWVRLSDAGLGCPDWPGCYGSLIVPAEEVEQTLANQNFPERPLEASKAWKEMIHRYVAATLGFCIVIIALLAWLNRHDKDQPVVVPLALLALVIFQGLLGMWTVTLLLKPVIVMAHLLGGLATTALLFWLVLGTRRPSGSAGGTSHPMRALVVAGMVVLIAQIALGGWTSSNYAALACPDIPTCQGQWWPDQINFSEGFVMWRGLGVDYEFGVLEAPARVAIHFTHRLGAIVTFLFLGFVAFRCFSSKQGQPAIGSASMLVLIALLAQLSLGLAVVWFGLPLPIATAHNGVAALLLLATVNLLHIVSRARA